MNSFWNIVMHPIFEAINAQYIVEIGFNNSINTKNILEYCSENDAHVTVIDPFPKYDIDEYKSRYHDKIEFYTDTGINRLTLLKDYDVIVLDNVQDTLHSIMN